MEAKEGVKRLREIVLEGNGEWRDKFSDYLESLDDSELEVVLTLFIEEVARKRIYGFETFVEIYEITSAVWHARGIYLPWVEVVSKYGTDAMFQIMDEDVNSDEIWFVLLVLSSAWEIGTDRVRRVLGWLDDGGHDLEEMLEDYVNELNSSSISENDYDVALILELCAHLKIDVRTEAFAFDGGKVAQKIAPFLEGV